MFTILNSFGAVYLDVNLTANDEDFNSEQLHYLMATLVQHLEETHPKTIRNIIGLA